jgi:hypothetical protein
MISIIFSSFIFFSRLSNSVLRNSLVSYSRFDYENYFGRVFLKPMGVMTNALEWSISLNSF